MAGTPSINLNRALEALSELQNTSPPSVAHLLGQIGALMQSLADENAYLNTLLAEGMPQASPAVEDLTRSSTKTVTALLSQQATIEEDSPQYLLMGLNEVMRPPLIAIRGRAELVQAGMLGGLSEEQEQWLQAIHENTDRAFAVLDAMQQVLALQNGQVQIGWSNFISTDLLSEAHDRIHDKAQARQHEVAIHAPETVPMARGDFYQSLIILTDLLDNAVRYTPEGGQIRLSVDNLGTHVLFSVADNGIGLNEDDRLHVGQPFWRGEHQRLVRQHPGTGLRLYLARHILALQQGELIFSGEEGVGSTFSFTLLAPE
jgi:signal transduction histidine kinase